MMPSVADDVAAWAALMDRYVRGKIMAVQLKKLAKKMGDEQLRKHTMGEEENSGQKTKVKGRMLGCTKWEMGQWRISTSL